MKTEDGAEREHMRVAVGLAYHPLHDRAPVVAIKGMHFAADEIIRVARLYGIPVVSKKALARSLFDIEEDQEIPQQLYEVVAQLLYELDKGDTSSHTYSR
jgi:flagellar biosynthesis protein